MGKWGREGCSNALFLCCFLPTPLAGGRRKIICGANEFSLAFGQGGGHLIFDVCFDFQCATPRGLIRDTTVGGNGALQAANLIFHCATPRGLIRDTTVGGNGALLAANSIFHCAYPKGAHSWHHRWGQWGTSGCKFQYTKCWYIKVKNLVPKTTEIGLHPWPEAKQLYTHSWPKAKQSYVQCLHDRF